MSTNVSQPDANAQIDRRALIAGIGGLAAGATLFAGRANAGPLAPPPGPIASTGRTVQEIYDKIARTDVGLAEPRIPVQSLPSSATALHVISQPGSYYLTGNIIGEPGKNGIEIAANSVSIDLCGHAVTGVPAAINGIWSAFYAHTDLLICNGSVTDWPLDQVDIRGSRNAAHRLFVRGGRDGILIDAGVCTDSVATNCSGFGIRASQSVVENCVVNFAPIALAGGSVARGCRASGGFSGFDTVFANSVLDCRVSGVTVGVILRGGSMVTRCGFLNCDTAVDQGSADEGGLISDCLMDSCGIAVKFNGYGGLIDKCVVQRPRSFGVLVTNSSRIRNCHVVGERADAPEPVTAFGLGAKCLLEECTATDVRHGVVTSGLGNFVGGCRIGGALTPYAIAAGNAHGPIVNVAGLGDVSSVAGTDHPMANLVY